MASLSNFFPDHHKFLKEITKKPKKEENKKNFVAHQKFSKIFRGPSLHAGNISLLLQKSSGSPLLLT